MCFILFQHITTDNEKDIEKILTVTRDQIERKSYINNDALYLKDARGEYRTDDIITGRKAIDSAEGKLIISHLRYGTSGENTVLNAHGWERKGWRLVHNGFCGNADTKDEGFCDSALFFNKLAKKIEGIKSPRKISERIIGVADDFGFSGRAILWNEEMDMAFTFGDFCMYFNDDVFVLSSIELILEDIEEKTIYKSLSIAKEGAESYGSKKVNGAKLDGVWGITNFSKPDFDFINLGKLKPYSYIVKTRTNPYKGMTKKERKETKRLEKQEEKEESAKFGSEDSYGYHNIRDGYYDQRGAWTPYKKQCDLPVENTFHKEIMSDEEFDLELDGRDVEDFIKEKIEEEVFVFYDIDKKTVHLKAQDEEILPYITSHLLPERIADLLKNRYHLTVSELGETRFNLLKGEGLYIPAHIAGFN